MHGKTDAELVEMAMADVVRPMIEDSARFRAWLDANRDDDPIFLNPSRWEVWRAGKADLAQQVWDKVLANVPEGFGVNLSPEEVRELRALLRQYDAGKE